MSKGFPCPNPTCTYEFPADAVRRAAALACPRCRTVYQFRSEPPAKPPSLPAPPPVAVPVAPPVGMEFEPAPGVVIVPPRRRAGWNRLAIAAGVFLALGSVVAGALWWAAGRDWIQRELAEEARAFRALGNFAFRSAPGWRSDHDLRQRMRINLALTRGQPRGHMALAYRDFKSRAPADGELLDLALARLRSIFPQLQYDDPFQADNRGRHGELDGEPAIVFIFAGTDHHEVPMRGECWMLTRHGYGYWLFFWGPEDDLDRLRPSWERLRAGFQLLNEREGWKPRPRPSETVALKDLPLQLSYAPDVWRKEDNPKAHDERAVLALRGFEPTEDEETGRKRVVEYAGKSATVLVLVLPKADNPAAAVQAALEHIEKRKKETNRVQIEPVTDRKTGKPITADEVGAVKGRLTKLHVRLDGDTEKYAVLAVVNDPAGMLVIYGECKGDRHGFWDAEFMAILQTVRPLE